MVSNDLTRKIFVIAILLILLVLAFIIVKPFFGAIVLGIIMAYVLQWPHKKLTKLIKKPGISAGIICVLFFVILTVGVYFLAQIIIKEAFNLYLNVGKIDLLALIDKMLGFMFPNSPDMIRELSITVQRSITEIVNALITEIKGTLLNIPSLITGFFVSFFVAFYGLKDGKKIVDYIREILPFQPEINDKFIKRSEQISFATIYGQVAVGIIQGLTAGIGFYMFKTQSPFLFTMLAVFFAMLPLLGAWVVWIPVSLSMIATGSQMNGILLAIYGLLVISTIDNIVRPFIIGKKSKINPLIVFIGMLGGIIVMGPVGIIAGPIILEFLLIFIELYRTNNLKIRS
ncbi:MAG: AI-2E family transporter [Candidatus Pacearchaeota archaeon]|nr:AI-2E family transporter [Candidatus Pacearchaeota archaeon]